MCHINRECDGYHVGKCPHAHMEMVGAYDNPDFQCAYYNSEFWDEPLFEEKVINTPMED